MRIPRRKKKLIKKKYNSLRIEEGLKPYRKLIAYDYDKDGVTVIPKKSYLFLKYVNELNNL